MPDQNQFDCIIIGSGFGGSVAALRLSEKGYRVAVLEKGKRYETSDFPKTNWNLKKSIWMPPIGLHGIQAISMFQHVMALHGTGVGGGSLVYANQLLIPPDEVFEKHEWGPGDWKQKLDPHFNKARQMLGATPCPSVGNADKILREVGMEIRGEDTFHINEVSVYFGEPDITVPDPYFDGEGPDRTGCTHCGACLIGCPVGAKNTLDKNYLYLAEKLGAKIFSETEAIEVHQDDGGYRILTQKPTSILKNSRIFRASSLCENPYSWGCRQSPAG